MIRSAVLALVALVFAQPALAGQLTDAQKARIDKAVTNALTRAAAPSASIAVVTDGQIDYVRAYGQASISPAVAATPTMRYAIGSVSKQFTAAAILMLAEEGRLSLDEPIARWYPKVTGADRITLRHLLSHTSGIADFWPQDYVMKPMTKNTDPDKIIAEWGAKPLAFKTGSKYEYSNTGFMIAGRVVEKVSGQTLEAFLRQRIWAPLAMTSVISFDRSGLSAPRDASGYFRAALAAPRPAPRQGAGWGRGAFEWAMTAEDLAKWNLALLTRPAIMKPASWSALTGRTRLTANFGSVDYALGLAAHRRGVGHTGEVSGFVAAQEVYPAERIAFAALVNQDNTSAASDIVDALNGIVLPPIGDISRIPVPREVPAPDPPAPPPGIKDSVASLFDALRKGGKPDNRLMTKNLADYFTPAVRADFAASLAPFGDPVEISLSGPFTGRGGMAHGSYRVGFTDRRSVKISVYACPDGRLEQFLVGP